MFTIYDPNDLDNNKDSPNKPWLTVRNACSVTASDACSVNFSLFMLHVMDVSIYTYSAFCFLLLLL